MTRGALTILVFVSLTITACTPAAATTAVPASPTLPPTQTLLPTLMTPSLTSSPTGTATLPPTRTFTPEPTSTSTFTPVPYLPPNSTRRPEKPKPSDSPTPTDTATVTLEPPLTFCPPPTPEPLWVEPVTSPTDQLSQIITVHVGYGTEVTISAESGTFTVTGSFGAYANPALVEITLLPNTVHHLGVSAKIQPPPSNGCTYGTYTLQTSVDQSGAPLVIVQGTAVP